MTGKCCRATVAVSTANSGSPSMTKPSKLSADQDRHRFRQTSGRCASRFRSAQSRKSKATGLRRLDQGSKSRREFPQKRAAVWRPAQQESCPPVVGNERLTHPDPLRRRRRKRGPAPFSCAVRKCTFATARNAAGAHSSPRVFWSRFLSLRPTLPQSKRQTDLLSIALEPVDEGLTRQDRSRRDRQIRFRFGRCSS